MLKAGNPWLHWIIVYKLLKIVILTNLMILAYYDELSIYLIYLKIITTLGFYKQELT